VAGRAHPTHGRGHRRQQPGEPPSTIRARRSRHDLGRATDPAFRSVGRRMGSGRPRAGPPGLGGDLAGPPRPEPPAGSGPGAGRRPGLAAAWELVEAGHDVTVLEASRRSATGP